MSIVQGRIQTHARGFCIVDGVLLSILRLVFLGMKAAIIIIIRWSTYSANHPATNSSFNQYESTLQVSNGLAG